MKINVAVWVFLCFAASNAFALDTCQINGQEVNLNNGSSTAGKTGMVVCKNSSGEVVRELEYVNGKHIGREMVVNGMGEKVEKVVNEKGNSNGPEKHYDRNGKLLSENNFENGREQGLQKKYNIKGKLMSLTFMEKGQSKFRVSYDDSGKPDDLHCGDKSYTPEDVSLCGFSGKASTVKLGQYKDKEVVYKNGKMVESSTFDDKGKLERNEKVNGDTKEVTELFPDGKLKIKASYIGHALNGEEQEFHSSGKLIRKTNWNKGHMESEWKYFLNGSPEAHSVREQKGKKWFLNRELYWDNTKPKDTGSFEEKTDSFSWEGFRLDRWSYNSPIGEHKHFFENGNLSEVGSYNDNGEREGIWKSYWESGKPESETKYVAGKMRAQKEWDRTGKKTRDEEYYEDGSRVKK